MKYHLRTFTCSIAIFCFAFLSNANAQNDTKNYLLRTEFGYISTFLMGTNTATYPILSFPDRGGQAVVAGSGFFGAQSGFSARLNYQFGSTQQYIIPFGIDMTFYRGYQRQENLIGIGRAGIAANTVNFVAGFQHRILKLPLAEGFLYGGGEATITYAQGPKVTYSYEEKNTGEITSSEYIIKDDAWRAGGALRLGVQGNINEPLRINISCAYGIMNLIGRDLRTGEIQGTYHRGELLTPTTLQQTQELFVHYLQYSFLLQYTF